MRLGTVLFIHSSPRLRAVFILTEQTADQVARHRARSGLSRSLPREEGAVKRFFALLLGMTVIGGFASAQEASAEAGNTYEVTFYKGDPADNAEVITAEEMAANSSIQRNEDLEDAEYVTIEYAGQSYTFEVAKAGASANSVYLDIPTLSETPSVAELLREQNTNPGALERYSN